MKRKPIAQRTTQVKKPHYPKLRWQIDTHTKCPCGSNQAFRKCCRGNEHLIGKAHEFLKAVDLESAEKARRAEITRYIGWVYQHTLPALQRPTRPVLQFASVDVSALENLAELIATVFEQSGKREAILHTFDHLAATIPLPGLRERMAALKCFWLYTFFDDIPQADRVLADWPSHEKIQDYRLLQVWYERRAHSLSPIQRIAVAKRLIEISASPAEKLQYSCLRSMLTILGGDLEEAKRLHTTALNDFLVSASETARTGDHYASSTCADALELEGTLNNNKVAFDRALSFLENVDLTNLTARGAGGICYSIGRLYWHKDDSVHAVEWFTKSYDYNPRQLPLIYRLDAYVRMDAPENAKRDLATLERMGVPEDLKLEFLRSATGLAVRTGDAEAARKLVGELKVLDLAFPNFREQRDKMCIELLEFASEQLRKNTTPARRQSLWCKIQQWSQYFELKPNVCGLGLNLNRIFDKDNTDVK